MAETDNTTSTPPAAQTQPVQNESVNAAANNVAAQNNAGEKPNTSRSMNQSNEQRILEINELLNKGVLSVDQRAKLEDEKKKLEHEGGGGTTKQLRDKDVKRKRPEDNKFAEQDIIKYMYNEWLIKLGCWCGSKIEQGLGTAYDRLERRIDEGVAMGKARAEAIMNTETYKNAEKLNGLTQETSEAIKKRYQTQSETVQKLARSISNGNMGAESATELLALAKYLKVNPEEVGQNKEIQEIVQASLKHRQNTENLYQSLGITAQQVQENPRLVSQKMQAIKQQQPNSDLCKLVEQQNDAVVASQKELCSLGAKFAQKESRRIVYDSTLDQTALSMSQAKIIDAIAKDSKAYQGKDITTIYKSEAERYRRDLMKNTAQERQSYIDGKNKKFVQSHPEARPIEINSMEVMDKYNSFAHRAVSSANKNIKKLRFQEMDKINGKHKDPRPNKALAQMEEFMQSGQEPTSEQLQQADKEITQDEKRQAAEKETSQTNTQESSDLQKDTQQNFSREQSLQEARGKNRQQQRNNEQLEATHQQKGSWLYKRTEAIKNKIKEAREGKTGLQVSIQKRLNTFQTTFNKKLKGHEM